MNAIAGLVMFALAPLAHADCLDSAASYFSLDPQLVRAIAQHESGMNAKALNQNANGSIDIGLMQINSSWLPMLVHHGIKPERLLDPCVNAYVGAWILRTNIERFGPTWKAVGAYNDLSPAKQLQYANQIYARWRSMHAQVHISNPP